MASIHPFRALRPAPARRKSDDVVSPPRCSFATKMLMRVTVVGLDLIS